MRRALRLKTTRPAFTGSRLCRRVASSTTRKGGRIVARALGENSMDRPGVIGGIVLVEDGEPIEHEPRESGVVLACQGEEVAVIGRGAAARRRQHLQHVT